ncbi:MAG: hypothetical protein ACLRZ6_00755 [Lachnospiraceae bacterium]
MILLVCSMQEVFKIKRPFKGSRDENCVRKPYFIPENMKAASLFSNMKKTGNYLQSQLMSMAEWQE